jgi:uncharacterized iron-regulated protein
MSKVIMPVFFFIFLSFQVSAQDLPAYRLLDSSGKEVSFKKMMKTLEDADFVFVGESHDNPISHWMELEISKALYEKKQQDLVLSAEMFESDNQLILNEYLQGLLTDKRFEDEARIWKNYKTDYKPLVLFAKEKKLSFVASNVPRHYAGLVSDKGFGALDALTPEAKQWMAPLPINYDSTLACYKDMLAAMGGSHGATNMSNLPRAQALKDATMAYYTAKAWSKGKTVIHFNGSYHSDKHQGIVWHIQQQLPQAKIITITTLEQDDTSKLDKESEGMADFIILVPMDMTRTF